MTIPYDLPIIAIFRPKNVFHYLSSKPLFDGFSQILKFQHGTRNKSYVGCRHLGSANDSYLDHRLSRGAHTIPTDTIRTATIRTAIIDIAYYPDCITYVFAYYSFLPTFGISLHEQGGRKGTGEDVRKRGEVVWESMRCG